MNKNPFESIQSRLEAIEHHLIKIDSSFVPNKDDVWEEGTIAPCEVFGVNNTVILQNLEDIPHFKLRGVLYFNRKILKNHMIANAYSVSILGLK